MLTVFRDFSLFYLQAFSLGRRFYVATLAALIFVGFILPTVSAQEVVVGEDADGRLTVKAVRYDGNIDLDGVLDEGIYTQIEPADYFIQQLPD